MAYDPTDPRASLVSVAPQPTVGLIASEQAGRFYDASPDLDQDGAKSWLLRGANFVLVWSSCDPGATLQRAEQPDEYVFLLPDRGTRARISWHDETIDVTGPRIVFIPAGDSAVNLPDGGRVVRLFTSASRDQIALCPNATAYDEPRTHIPPLAVWPAPPGGWRLRSYGLDVAPQPGRFGRIFRCTTFMVNVLDQSAGPRDPSKLSPHHHDDFEQCSLAISGRFTHHLRWPWTTDMADWRPDQHIDMASPSALVIPPPVIHTSRATDPGINELVDIFCPPRIDFSLKPGWVLNADDYPLPEG